MHFRSFVFLATLFGTLSSYCQVTRVLFVGNSYTAGMPQVVMEIADAAGDSLDAMESSAGGQRLSGHAQNPELSDIIRNEDFDYVVIQAQSQECSFPDGQVATEVIPYAKQLCDSIRANNACTIPMFYMTWGRENGDAQNCSFWPPVCTYEGMDSIIYSNYLKLGEANSAEVSPAGAVWRWIRENAPSVKLYSGDGSHPSQVGTMATAYTFYTAIYRKSPDSSSYLGGLPQTTVDTIKMAVKSVLLDSMSTFYIGVNDPDAKIFSIKDGCSYELAGEEGYDQYIWDFGDGEIGVGAEVSHMYDTEGIYTVKLTIENCGMTVQDSISVRCGVNSLIENSKIVLNVYPNPSSGNFSVTGDWSLVMASNNLGQPIETVKSGNNYTLQNADKGLILLQLKDLEGRLAHKFIIIE